MAFARVKAVMFGIEAMTAKIKRVRVAVLNETAKALRQETEIEATEAKRRTPVEFGNLRASIHAEGPFAEGRKFYSTIVAGGVSAPYAIYVHENLDAYHHVGQAKFLESVILESRPYMGQRIAARIAFNKEHYGHVV